RGAGTAILARATSAPPPCSGREAQRRRAYRDFAPATGLETNREIKIGKIGEVTMFYATVLRLGVSPINLEVNESNWGGQRDYSAQTEWVRGCEQRGGLHCTGAQPHSVDNRPRVGN